MPTPPSRPRLRMMRLLLRLLPLDFRIEHGRELEQVWRTEQRDANQEGTRAATLRFWWRTMSDLFSMAPSQHVAILQQDVNYALRTLRRTPAFTLAAIGTLAIGISACATIFTILNAFLFRPLPVDRPDQLVSIATLDHHIEMPHGVSYRDMQDYAELADVFSGLLGYLPQGAWLDTGRGSDRVVLEVMSENAFSLLGIQPGLGRLFGPSDRDAAVIVLANDYWRSRFAADASIIGRTIRLNLQPFTVIGVTAERFDGLTSLVRVSGFVPISMGGRLRGDAGAGREWLNERDQHRLSVIGRLRTGVTLDRARAALTLKTRQLADQYPDTNRGVSLLVVPETHARPVPQNGPMFHVAAAVLSVLAALLLIVTSANVANMLLARAVSRAREIALRAALGARRGRLVRQLVTESLVLAVAGSAGAVFLSGLAAAAMESGIESLDFEAPLRVNFGVDWRVIAATMAVAVTGGVLAGLAPALFAHRADANSLLKAGGHAGESRERGRLRGVLIVAQIAVSVVLLVVGGLFVRTLDRARSIDIGFRSDHVLIANVDVPHTYTDEQRRAYFREAGERVAALPGVVSTAWISGLPFGFAQGDSRIQPVDQPEVPAAQKPLSLHVSVSAGFFEAAGVALRAGRTFDARDAADAPRVAVINETFARQMWPNGDPVGRRVRLTELATSVEVVGIVADGKYILLWEAPRPMIYTPVTQNPPPAATLEVVTARAPEDGANAVRLALQEVDPDVPIRRLQSMEDYLENGQAFLLFRIGALLTGVCGLVGLTLASIGLYGVVSYDVVRRTREVGVRIALGARRCDIVRQVVVRGTWFALAGSAVGLVLAAALSWTLRTMFMGLSPFDAWTYASTMLLLIVVCLLASYLPARQATLSSPIEALRAD